ncbi:MAG: nitroreductase family protein [Conexivisphaerales archaeon]
MDVFEYLDTLISIRRFKEDIGTIDEKIIDRIIESGTRAPSPANTQPWDFIIVRDGRVKAELAKLNRECALIYIGNRKLPMQEDRKRYLLNSLDKMSAVPVMIVLCVDWRKADFMKKEGTTRTENQELERLSVYGSIFPAMQNMLIAARALNIGCWITMYHLYKLEEFRKVLHIPQEVDPVVMLSLGHPKGRFKTSSRKNFREMIHYDGW